MLLGCDLTDFTNTPLKRMTNVAHNLRATTEKRNADKVEAAQAKKKAEMGFVEIDCEQLV